MRQLLNQMEYVKKETMDKVLLVRLMSDLVKIHNTFLEKQTEIRDLVNAPLRKGDKGDKPTKAELMPMLREIISEMYPENKLKDIIAPLIPQVRDGNDGHTYTKEELTEIMISIMPKKKDMVITEEHLDKIAEKVSKKIKPKKDKVEVNEIDPLAIIDKIMALPKGKGLSTKHIDGLDQTISAFQTQLKRGYLHGGGISSLIAGTGIVLTRNSDGSYTIASSAGGFSVIPVSGTIDDSNKSFTAASEPTLLNINGGFYQKTGGSITWTYLAGNITLSTAVGTGGSIFGV